MPRKTPQRFRDLETPDDFRDIVKIDLHNHFSFGFRSSFLPIPTEPLSRYNDVDHMIRYAKENIWNQFSYENSHRTYFDFCAKFTPKTAWDDNVAYLETAIDSSWSYRLFYPDPIAFISCVEQLAKVHAPGLTVMIDMGISPKFLECEFSLQWFESCLATGGIASIDIYSCENKGFPFSAFTEHARIAADSGTRIKVHIGEFSSDELMIIETIKQLNVNEIQHGLNAARSEYILSMLRDRGIGVNLCPTSNLALGLLPDMKQHPIKKFHDEGIPVTINTDDVLFFGSTLSNEYKTLHDAGVFSRGELLGIAADALCRRGIEHGSS